MSHSIRRPLMAAFTMLGIVACLSVGGEIGSLAADTGCGDAGPGCHCDQCGSEVCDCDECVVVPDTKTTKKWIYSTKLVPFCVKSCPNPFKCRQDGCESCTECESCVRYKRVLIKREVVTKTEGFKCIPLCEACKAAEKKAKEQQEKSKAAPKAEKKPDAGEPSPAPGAPKTGPTATRDRSGERGA